MANTLALIVLFSALPISLIAASRYGFERSYIACVFFMHLFLPNVTIDIPFFIPTGKPQIIGIFSIIALFFLRNKIVFEGKTFGILFFVFSVLFVVGSALQNTDSLVRNGIFYQGASAYQGLSEAFKWLLLIVPYIFGMLVLSRSKHIENILRSLVIFGVLYSFLILYEARFSPRLHVDFYGFFQHSFAQHFRDGGWRPIVFMSHGLHVAFFAVLSLCSLLILIRSRLVMSNLVEKSKLALLGLAVVLCKSLGSLIFAVLAVPLLWVGSRTMIAGTAFFLAIVVITFPITRSADVFPTEQVLDVARVIDPNRAESLKFRFSNEDTLLAHAAERPIWGWGPNGRNFAVSDAGSDAVFDGLWIIMIGSRGWLGFFATFFLLLYPIYLVWRLRAHPEVPFTAIGASLLLALNMVEWLPNSTIGPWTWLLAGSLTGYAVSVGKTSQQSPSKPIQGRTENRRRTVI